MAAVHAAGNTGAETGLDTAQGHDDRPGHQAQGLGGLCGHLFKTMVLIFLYKYFFTWTPQALHIATWGLWPKLGASM